VRACAVQAERLLEWAEAWPERAWAVEGAGGLGHLLAHQLLSAGERVLDVQPKLGARVRLLATGNVNNPNDARSVAVAALRSPGVREARADDHAAVLKLWSKRQRDLGSNSTQVVCRLHAVPCELVPGGVAKKIIAAHAARAARWGAVGSLPAAVFEPALTVFVRAAGCLIDTIEGQELVLVPAHDGRRPHRRSACHPAKLLARRPFRRAAPKSFMRSEAA
jgi:hypothetical protein